MRGAAAGGGTAAGTATTWATTAGAVTDLATASTTAIRGARPSTTTTTGWGGGISGKRVFIRAVLRHVNATPAQARAIGDAVEEFRADVKKLGGGEARRSRQEIADALRRPTFDGVVLGEQFARHDTVIEGARKAFVGLVARVHDALEPEQRHAAGLAGRARPALRLVAVDVG